MPLRILRSVSPLMRILCTHAATWPLALSVLLTPMLASASVISLPGDGDDGTDTGTILDPVGDAGGGPDIVSIDGRFDASTLVLTAVFAPGTLDPGNLGFIFGLDTDLNPSTGIDCTPVGPSPPPSFPCGAEWAVSFFTPRDPTNAVLVDVQSPDPALWLPVTFDTDSLMVSVPLNPDPLIGLPDDGLAFFGLVVGTPISDSAFHLDDIAPDSSSRGPLGGPTVPVPQPSTALLLSAGLGALGLRRRR